MVEKIHQIPQDEQSCFWNADAYVPSGYGVGNCIVMTLDGDGAVT